MTLLRAHSNFLQLISDISTAHTASYAKNWKRFVTPEEFKALTRQSARD